LPEGTDNKNWDWQMPTPALTSRTLTSRKQSQVLIQNMIRTVRGSGAAQQITQRHQRFTVTSGAGLEFLPTGPFERTGLGAGCTQELANLEQAVPVPIDQSGAQSKN
jgi:hypothetical protein